MCLEILLKMVYARNVEEYSNLYEEPKNTPQSCQILREQLAQNM